MLDHLKPMGHIVVWLALLMLAGCVHKPASVQETPPWHYQSSGAFVTSAGRVFYGIGQAQGAGNATIMRATAANRARKEMARVLDSYVTQLFQSTGTMPAMTMEEGERVIGTLVRRATQQSVISNSRSDPRTVQYHALCQLDLETLKQIVASQPLINDNTRSVLWSLAEQVHARMADNHFQP
jgi:hypothetical protein